MSFNVHDGSFGKGGGNFSGGLFYLPKRSGWGFETIKVAQVVSAEIASEQSVKRLGGTIGWGAAGGLVLGPVGLLAGLLLGGKKTEVAFIVSFNDGKAFIATADHKVWVAIKGASLGPVSANQAARERIAARALATTSEAKVKRSPSLTGPPDDYVGWAFDEGGWTYQKIPKQGSQRFTLIRGEKGLRSLLVALTPDPITEYSIHQILGAFEGQAIQPAERVIIGKIPARDIERTAERLGIRIATLSDLKVLTAGR